MKHTLVPSLRIFQIVRGKQTCYNIHSKGRQQMLKLSVSDRQDTFRAQRVQRRWRILLGRDTGEVALKDK